jgi:hypothetical protein
MIATSVLKGTIKMELDQALEFAVASSWNELVKPGESCSVHVEYVNEPKVPLRGLEIWMIKNRGYGLLMGTYSVASASASASAAPHAELPPMHFAKSYASQKLADNLEFIMSHQDQYSRAPSSSVHGLVQIGPPTEDEKKNAAAWSGGIHTGIAKPGVPALVN